MRLLSKYSGNYFPTIYTRVKKSDKLKALAIKTLEIEATAISHLKNFIDDDFIACVHHILTSKGRVVVTGVGKSAVIAQKIVATLNSTGTPSIFMHAADAIHGDLGIIQRQDIIICISKSGDTPEIKVLVPLLRSWGNKLIGMTGNTTSYLAKHADLVLNTWVAMEACPNNLAPTSSSTAQMAMGDALAVCLLESRGFSSRDFAKFHPGGALGKKLYLKVKDIYPGNAAPQVTLKTDIRKVIVEITSNRLGAAAVLNGSTLAGIITDGDIRRMMLHQKDFQKLTAKDIMSPSPKAVEKDTMAVDALALMRENNITQLIITDKGKYVGMIHLHDLVKEGII